MLEYFDLFWWFQKLICCIKGHDFDKRFNCEHRYYHDFNPEHFYKVETHTYCNRCHRYRHKSIDKIAG